MTTKIKARCQKCGGEMTVDVDDDVMESVPPGTVFMAQHEVCPGEDVSPPRRFRVEVKVFELDVAHDLGPFVTKSGRVLTDADIEALADEAEVGYDPAQIKRANQMTVGRFGVTVEAEDPKAALEQLAPKLQERWQKLYNAVDIAEEETEDVGELPAGTVGGGVRDPDHGVDQSTPDNQGDEAT